VHKLADECRHQRQEDLVSDLIHADEEASGMTNKRANAANEISFGNLFPND
jgi:hypothetical protein